LAKALDVEVSLSRFVTLLWPCTTFHRTLLDCHGSSRVFSVDSLAPLCFVHGYFIAWPEQWHHFIYPRKSFERVSHLTWKDETRYLPIPQVRAQLLMTSQITSCVEYLISTYDILVLFCTQIW